MNPTTNTRWVKVINERLRSDLERVIRLEPRAGLLLSYSRHLYNPRKALDLWYGRRWTETGIKGKVVKLVGWHRDTTGLIKITTPEEEEFLRSSVAYDALYFACLEAIGGA